MSSETWKEGGVFKQHHSKWPISIPPKPSQVKDIPGLLAKYAHYTNLDVNLINLVDRSKPNLTDWDQLTHFDETDYFGPISDMASYGGESPGKHDVASTDHQSQSDMASYINNNIDVASTDHISAYDVASYTNNSSIAPTVLDSDIVDNNISSSMGVLDNIELSISNTTTMASNICQNLM